ncbi:alpha/beta fold hydrolase [Secundilactobacillus paracollinoides]|uniref:alpha/beta fold hydrolase n=1 Tax=Secundilactobacillus paracollinoides TaxID=240427 RepID=UPI0006D0CD77|nr:alpha/beta hydrolase [Secundilactobacillus paracollinoides]KRL79295.1 arylesterase, non-heme chloride peroxidase [Secundilactobacillus paracollinoides DSM 15502 = JCM 11969]
MAQYITSDDTQIYFTDTGSGPALLLAHGYGCTSRYFKNNIPELSKHFRVIAVDLRGQGHSNKATKGPRVSRLATDIHELLISLNLTNVTYLGWSMGASVGWCYWDLFGSDRLAKFIFVDEPALAAADPDNPTGAMSIDDLIAFQNNMRDHTDQTIETFIRSLLHKTTLNIDDLVTDSQLGNVNFLSQLIFNHHVLDWSDVLPTITLPSLVLSGENSLVNWKSTKHVSDLIPNSQFVRFSDAGHMLFFEYPEKFNQVVTEFTNDF